MSAVGYAVKQNGHLSLRTLMPDERGAMVNWLVTERRMRVSADWSDDLIAQVFARHAPGAGAKVVKVAVTEVQ